MRIASVTARGRRLPHAAGDGRLRVTLPRRLRAGERDDARDRVTPRARARVLFVGPTEASRMTAVRLVPGPSRRRPLLEIPCLDTPESRATLEMIVTVPAGYRRSETDALVARRANARPTHRHLPLASGHTHPAYLISLVVGEYVELRDGRERRHYSTMYRAAERRMRAGSSEDAPHDADVLLGSSASHTPTRKYAQSTVYDFTFGGWRTQRHDAHGRAHNRGTGRIGSTRRL